MLVGLDEGVLHGVRGGLGIAGDDGQRPDEAAVLRAEEHLELVLRVRQALSTP